MANETNFTTITPVKSSSSRVIGNHDGFVDVQSDNSDTTAQPIKAGSPDSGANDSNTAQSIKAGSPDSGSNDSATTTQSINANSSDSGVTASQTALPQTGVFDHPNTPVIGGECLLLLMVVGILSRRFFKNKWKAD